MSIGSYSNIATSPTTTLYDRATAAHSNNAHGRSHSLDDFTIYYRILPRDITIAYIYSPRIPAWPPPNRRRYLQNKNFSCRWQNAVRKHSSYNSLICSKRYTHSILSALWYNPISYYCTRQYLSIKVTLHCLYSFQDIRQIYRKLRHHSRGGQSSVVNRESVLAYES